MNPARDPLVRSAMAAGSAAVGPHPDAEILGLFADRALEGAELRAVETHIASCVRCQAIVGDLAVSAPVDEPEGAAGAAGVLGWFTGWRWAMPVASLAAVAAIALWVGSPPLREDAAQVADATPAPEFRNQGSSDQATTAPRAAAAARALEVPLPAPDALASGASVSQPPAPLAPQAVAPPRGAGNPTALQDAKTMGRAMAEPPAPSGQAAAGPGAGDIDAVAKSASASRTPVAPVSPRSDASALDAGGRAEPTPVGARDMTANVFRERTATTGAGALAGAATTPPPPTASPAPPEAALEARAERSAAPPAPAAASAPALASEPRPTLARPAPAAAATAASPRRARAASAWRVTAGRLERSSDDGRVWRRAATPGDLRVIAVAEVSARVAWAVAADAVIRTVDGDSWARVSVPPGAPFRAVAATSADDALVTAAAGARYATADGGATWRRVP